MCVAFYAAAVFWLVTRVDDGDVIDDDNLKALAMNNRWTGLVVLLF